MISPIFRSLYRPPVKVSVALCVLTTLYACGPAANIHSSKSQNQTEFQWQSVLEKLELPEEDVAPASLPLDIQSHPDSQFESFEIRAVYKDESGEWSTLTSQLDRLQITDERVSDSDWAFNSIARVHISNGTEAQAIKSSREEFARVALKLADSTGQRIHIKDSVLTFNPESQCNSSIEFAGRDASNESFLFTAKPKGCPVSASSGFLNQWEFNAIPFQGQLSGKAVVGSLWLTHVWGNAFSTGGAVLLDQLRVQLSGENTQVLSITRTKRASGTGPRTITAYWIEENGQRQSVDIEWEDQMFVTSQTSGLSYPQRIVIRIPAKNYELALQPIVDLSEVSDTLGHRWSGGMLVSGSLAGIGFLDFQPLALKE